MKFPRASGILLHPTSLPAYSGVGDFGPAVYSFVDFLHESGQKLGQMLPLNLRGNILA
jgi:4-alpha-glucanotransferase